MGNNKSSSSIPGYQAEISARKNAPVTRQKLLNLCNPKATKNCNIPGDILKKV